MLPPPAFKACRRQATVSPPRKWGDSMKRKLVPYLLLLPAFVLICIFKMYPVFTTLQQAFFVDGQFTLATYQRVFAEKTFWNCLDVTLKFNVVTIPVQILISFVLALLVSTQAKGSGVFRTIYYIPFAVSTTVSVMVWNLMFQYNGGVINSFLSLLGVESQGFFNDRKQALWCIVVLCSWKGCGYWMMFMMAGIKNIDSSVYEAAKIDGASYLRTVWSIIIPLMKRVFLFVCVANTSSNMLLFAPMQLVTEGGPRNSTNVLMYEAYRSAFRYADMARCAVIVSVLLVILAAVSLFQFVALGDHEARDAKRAARKLAKGGVAV